jgi:integrase
MTKRRSRGEGGLHWDEKRQRWIATASLGFDARGKRLVRKASGVTKTEVKAKLKEMLRDHEDGLTIAPHNYTVAEAVTYWLTYGLSGRSAATVANYTCLAQQHIIPSLGARKLRDLSAEDIDRWLAKESKTSSTRTLRLLHSVLNRSVKHAQARDKVKRNVVALCDVPVGQEGRPSKSLTLAQAEAVLSAASDSRLHAYIVLSLLIGARTEELRALRWESVDLDGQPNATLAVLPSISVVRSVRAGGDTKTRKSRRRLAMPLRCVEVLRAHRQHQDAERAKAGARWQDHGLVFTSTVGTALDAGNVRHAFRVVLGAAGLAPGEWTPREMRHSFVSLLSDSGVPLEHISRLVGHSGTAVTESVYRQQIRPVMDEGATAMDKIFRDGSDAA